MKITFEDILVSLLVVVAVLNTPVTVIMLPYPVFFSVTERVSVYFLHFRIVLVVSFVVPSQE